LQSFSLQSAVSMLAFTLGTNKLFICCCFMERW
jgi:hypothetical protein